MWHRLVLLTAIMHPRKSTHITQMSDFLKVFSRFRATVIRFQVMDLGSVYVAFWRLSKANQTLSTPQPPIPDACSSKPSYCRWAGATIEWKALLDGEDATHISDAGPGRGRRLMGVTLRVLLVEDYEDDALLLLRELRRGGYEPLSERVDTAEAMETALDEREWDLVIADHSMPAFSSLAALELLRSKGFAELPFIIVSGHIGEDVAVAAMKAGAQDYIMKDNLARLNTAIERELREAESRRERRRAEEERRLAEEKYRGIFENAVEGIFQTTVEGRFVTANPAMARMFGYDSPEDLLENVSNIAEQLYVDPKQRTELRRLILRDGLVSGFETQARRKDGGVVGVSVSARAVRDVEGEMVGYEGTVEDVTERKQAERALREIREAERRRIARELHDVVLQDLTYALQSLQVIRRMPSDEPGRGEETERQIEALKRAVGGLRDAIYELRLENAQEQTLARTLASIVELNRQMTPERAFELVVEEGFPASISEPASLEVARVVQEALANIRRHSGARRARVTLGTASGEALVEVEDDGRGLEPGEPAGMGLTGMRERAHGLGGELEVEGERGVGTRVLLRVPLAALVSEDSEYSNARK
jgi:two-component system, NarL family, sensor histidine kinase UhpB